MLELGSVDQFHDDHVQMNHFSKAKKWRSRQCVRNVSAYWIWVTVLVLLVQAFLFGKAGLAAGCLVHAVRHDVHFGYGDAEACHGRPCAVASRWTSEFSVE